jgi:hypothetical protein
MQLGTLIWVMLVALALVLLVLVLPLETWWLSTLSTDKALTIIFRRLYRRSRVLGVPPDQSRTPQEFALALSARLERSTDSNRQAAVFDRLRADLDWLTGLYARMLFSQHSPDREEKEKAIHTWRSLRQRMGKIRR